MKAIISSTYDSKYLYFLPIVTFCWNRLGVDVICFMPYLKDGIDGYNPDKNKRAKYELIIDTLDELGIELQAAPFSAPEHKEATYAQCSRLYGACLDLPEDEILITADVDMAVFKKIWVDIPKEFPHFYIIGNDLTPDKQYPICYAYARVGTWRSVFELDGKAYQQCLDEHLGGIECENMRGNYWGADQEKLYNMASRSMPILTPRSNGQNQFATKRYDRDDSYILDRLSPDTIDFHMNRPGYEEKNFEIILTILKYHYPDEDFTWLVDYTNAYKQLL